MNLAKKNNLKNILKNELFTKEKSIICKISIIYKYMLQKIYKQ